MAQVMTGPDIGRAVRRISHQIVESPDDSHRLVLIGLHTRGVPLAQRLAATVQEIAQIAVPVGALDIGLHRDDLARRPVAELARTCLPVDITDRVVVLVDDVLYTGRTVRSALDALNDFGRPRAVRLAVLVDRGHRQLPIRPDHVGMNLPTSPTQRVSVHLRETDPDEGVWIDSQPSSDDQSPADPHD